MLSHILRATRTYVYGYTQKENCTADKREKASLEFNEFDVLGQEKEGVVIFPFFSSVKNLGKWQHTINGNGSFLYIVAAFICIPFTFLLMKKGLLLLFDYYFFTVHPNIWIIRETPDSAFVGSKSGRIEKSIWSALQEKKVKSIVHVERLLSVDDSSFELFNQ